ncbi:MAG: EF-P lysine aminoacylase EpmA [Pirellulales bacterium]
MTIRPVLALRASVRSKLRDLFDGSGFIEVDTPILSTEILPEAYIDPISIPMKGTRESSIFLQTSPEAFMKRLLAAGSGPVYQFARSFRDGERGRLHDVEFVLLEWYAPKTTIDNTTEFLAKLCTATVGTKGIERVTCTEAFQKFAGVNPSTASLDELRHAGSKLELQIPESYDRTPQNELHYQNLWDHWFEAILSEAVQPKLGLQKPTILEAWPASQSAFARLDDEDSRVAKRFELFLDGVELANGWEEETRLEIISSRIHRANEIRSADGRDPLPQPLHFLNAHNGTMPHGVGVALGFDRLVMLTAQANSIDSVVPFPSAYR